MHHRTGVKKSNRASQRRNQRMERRAERRIERGPIPPRPQQSLSDNVYELPDRPNRPSFADRGYLYDEQNTAGEFDRTRQPPRDSREGFGSHYQGGYSSGTYDSEGYGRKEDYGAAMERSWMPADDAWRPSNETNLPGPISTPTWDENHSGKGPKGFTRSDERIHEQVCEVLMDHPAIDASDIEVEVSNGEVTLTGTVRDRGIKRLTEDVLHELKCVREVHNQLRTIERKNSGSH